MGIEPSVVRVSAAAANDIRESYERGLYLTAYRKAAEIAPLHCWRGTSERILAGRMAGNLGAGRLGDWCFIHAYRENPGHAEALWYFANYLSNVRGPLRAWHFLQSHPLPEDASEETRSHWQSLHGRILGTLRDFDAADQWLTRAEGSGAHAWTAMERAAVLMFEDRHDEAEATVRKALEIRPWYRPGVQWLAHFLVQRERDDEATALLREACGRLESGSVWLQLHHLLRELDRIDEAAHALDEYERLSPLLDPRAGEWLAARRADLAYWRGDWETARAEVRRARDFAATARGPLRKPDTSFLDHFAHALDQPRPEKTAVELPVPFVRQHHQTCAPATLAAICRYWGKNVDHLEAADEITYMGTTHSRERRWAQENGFVTKEFTVTWDSAKALLDRGIPFTLTTAETTSSHLQALIGYDVVRKSFWIRDPGERHRREFFADAFFERYVSTGPRGMAMVPMERADLLRTLELPDEAQHDAMNRIESHLEKHRREEADAETQALEAAFPDHLIAWNARRMLETYDADAVGMLQAVEKILTRYPDDMRLLLAQASLLRELGRRDERLALLKRMADGAKADPAAWLQYAQQLSDDAREHGIAKLYLTKALRFHPGFAGNYAALSRIYWADRRFEAALELDRFALCLEDKDENLARIYFQNARVLRKEGEALDVLRRRFARFGAKAMLPARTLYFALVELNRIDEAMEVLRRALELRPDDGDLIAFVGDSYLAQGDFAQARTFLERAKGLCQPGMWLRYAAAFARQEGDLARCLELWKQVLELEPLAMDAHRNLAQTLAERADRRAAVEHLRAACERYPHHFQLAQLWFEWLREDAAPVRRPVLDRLVAIHPADAWTRRELALHLADEGKIDEAFAQLDVAAQLDPKNPSLWTTRSYLNSRRGNIPAAKEDCRQAIRLTVDIEIAQQDLLSLCDTLEERREALDFIETELTRQVTFGQGLLFFRDIALGTLEQEALLAALRKGLESRPDLWQSWAAVVRQLAFMERFDEALALARSGAERFPQLPAMWMELAEVQRGRRDPGGETEALQRALAISPNWAVPQRALAAVHERAGRLAEARAIFESAIQRGPLIAQNRIALAEFVAAHESKEKAIEIAAEALRLEPGAELAWSRYLEWSASAKRFDEAIAFARQATAERPGEARAWLRLAQALSIRPIDPDPEIDRRNIAEILQAYDEVLARNPRLIDAHDRKANLLADVSRWDEALAACRPAVFGATPPVPLLGRAAWILARRGNLPAAAAAMRDVLQRDRNYKWGWSNLADWMQALGRWDAYLEAADNLVRLNPADPVGLSYRGEAKVRLGRRDEGLSDLRRASELAPAYVFPNMLLFEEHFAANELDDANDVLARMRKHSPGDEVAVRELRLAVRSQDLEGALITLRKLGRAPGENPGPLQAAVQMLEAAGYAADVQRTLADLAADGRSHPYAAVLLCERTDPQASDVHERLRMLDKAIERLGAKSRALDLKAEMLCRAGRYDEALKVCRGPKSPDAELPLKGREAWILFQQGEHAKAADDMHALLNANPDYYWGWTQLALWAEHLGRKQVHLKAAERLTEIAPNDSLAHIERARAQQNLGELERARADFVRAIELNPRNLPLAHEVFPMLAAARDYDALDRVLAAVAPFAPPADVDRYRRLAEFRRAPLGEQIVRFFTLRGPNYADWSALESTLAFGAALCAALIAGAVALGRSAGR